MPIRARLHAALITTLAAGAPPSTRAQAVSPEPAKKYEDIVILEKFVADEKTFDTANALPTAPTRAVMGFDRPIVEIPRAVTTVNAALLDNLGIRNSEDLIKIAPTTYSNFRFGLQGNISIRNQTSEFYFRGMRRIDPQGNFRTLWTANDSLEIVRGPPSPIYGLGRIGGYVNFNPKTARLATTGKYLDTYTGQTRFTYGAYNKKILTAEVGGPIDVPFSEKKGGFHVYGYVENSDAWKVNNFDQQELVQATLSFDLTHDLRVEVGGMFQHSKGGLPGGINRTTSDTIARHTYWDGGFSYQLDENHDGMISEREVRNSYFRGAPQISALTNAPGRVTSTLGPSLYYLGQTNDPFFRTIPWQGSLARGLVRTLNPRTITLAQFLAGYTDSSPTLVGGAPVQRTGYQLKVYPTTTITLPSGKVDAIPNPAGTPVSFFLPPAFDLNPTSWVEKPLNKRQSFGEDYYEANVGAFFLDFVNDRNTGYMIRNQTLLDGHRQIKDGRNPFSQRQAPFTAENKTTVERKFQPRRWLAIDALASANVHYTDTYRVATNPTDIDFRRSLVHNDASRVEDTFTPNDTFYSMIARRGLDGSPPSSVVKSRYTESGLGALLDIALFQKLGLLIGGRWDYIDAHTMEPAGTYQKGGSVNPGAPYTFFAGTGLFTTSHAEAKASDQDTTWSASLSYELFKGVRPYATYSENAIIVQGSALDISPRTVLTNTFVGHSKLAEGGLKLSLFKDRLFSAFAYYEQTRAGYDVLTQSGTNTLTRGWEMDLRWVLNKHWTLISGASFSQAKYMQGANVSVDARSLGFPDVVDATGKVVIPAEAFGWGGRLSTVIPDSEPDYREVEGIPDRVVNFTIVYTPNDRWVLQSTVYHQGTYATDRMHTIHVPAATTVDALVGYRTRQWEINVNVTNVLDKEIWNKGSFYWLDPKFPRGVDFSYVKKF